jgi:uncharacterized protein with LGFP repeats
VNYQHGAIAWSASTGAHSVYGYAYTKWVALGRERGELGYPRAEKLVAADRWIQAFEKGEMADTGASVTSVVTGYTFTRYKQLGGASGVLGYPIRDKVVASDRWIQYFEKGVMADTTASVTAVVVGYAFTLWKQLGAESGTLGYPVHDKVQAADRWIQHFERGAIADTTSSYTQVVTGPVFAAWTADGAEGGRWGYPIGPVAQNADGTSSQRFEGGLLTA